ncbi:DUF5714 domain-containing protein [Azotosporobacter soli]|uniref:DUF5714 domain-containing protein n=1 Tax=Azotosporobacter soli TaxID=3055040 RepID=UPI0031FE9CD3
MSDKETSNACCPATCCASPAETHLQNCMVCGGQLLYQSHAEEKTCNYCGALSATSVFCPDGHYVCEACHGAGYYAFLQQYALNTSSRDPMSIAEALLQSPALPSLGGEHHPLVAAALLGALKNHGEFLLPDGTRRCITDADILEGMRRMKQIPSCSCAYHGACGAGLAVGTTFSLLLGATCANDMERTLAMRATNAALAAIADCGGPACCKQSVRTAILSGVGLLKELFRIHLPLSRSRCFHQKDTSHGCKGMACRFSR